MQKFTILEHQNLFLGNTYYDYPDHFLVKQKMGLRIRQEDQELTLTLKTNGNMLLVDCIVVQNIILLLTEKETPTIAQLRRLYPFEQLL